MLLNNAFTKNNLLKLGICVGIFTACGPPAPAPPTDLPAAPPVYTPAAPAVDARGTFQDTFKVNSLESALSRHVAQHSALKRDDSYNQQSDELFKYLELYKSAFFTLNENDIKKFDIQMSPDKRLGILNWGWREGSENLYRSVCVFKTNNDETKVTWLSNDKERMGMFHKMGSIPVQNGTLYIAKANFSEGQNRREASYGVQLFQIEGTGLKTPNLFPNESSRVSVSFDAANLDVSKMDPVIEQDGQVIKIPIVEKKANEPVFNGVYKVYRFDGTRFQLE